MEKISLSEKRIEELRREVSAFQDSRRFSHTLGVEKEAVRLGELFLPEDINRLRVAALLHDITKMYDYEKQLKCCQIKTGNCAVIMFDFIFNHLMEQVGECRRTYGEESKRNSVFRSESRF